MSTEGTGKLADVAGYHVAGKTGTAHIAMNGGYSADNYISVFAGMAPATDPRLVTVVVINQPSQGAYYGRPGVGTGVRASDDAAPCGFWTSTPDDLGSLAGHRLRAVNRGMRS